MRQFFLILALLLPVCAYSQPGMLVRINEVMADPKGLTAFPETEYVELQNRTDASVPLVGWSFSYGGKKVVLTDFSLPARGYVVLYRTGRKIQIDAQGLALPLDKFPSALANTGKELALYDASGTRVDAIAYEKAEPGVAWERVGDGFALSEDKRGGTPGSVNSVSDTGSEGPETPGTPGLPQLATVLPLSDTEFQLKYDKSVYIGDALFSIAGIGQSNRAIFADKEQTLVNIRFGRALDVGVEYILTCRGVKSKEGKRMPDDTFPLILDYEDEPDDPEEPDNPDNPDNPSDPDQPEPPVVPGDTDVLPGDIVFNELLPNPFPEGSEYIELYNRSDRTLSLAVLSIATRKTDGTLSTHYPLSSLTSPCQPGDYILLTKSADGVTPYYLISSPDALHSLKLPVLANTSATLVLFLTADETVIDEVSYSSKWHASSVKDQKGVSLERIDPDKDSRDATNWTSAAAIAGYGTPGYRNSQYRNADEGTTGIDSPVYSEQTGEYTIAYHLDQPGYTCRAWVFDTSGRRISEIANHESLGMEGQLRWDGLASNSAKVRMGIYILYLELVHTNGDVKCYKKAFLVK